MHTFFQSVGTLFTRHSLLYTLIISTLSSSSPIFPYFIPVNILEANPYTQRGMAPNAATVEINVIVIERSRDPPIIYVHMFDPAPPGAQPARKSPSHIEGSSANRR